MHPRMHSSACGPTYGLQGISQCGSLGLITTALQDMTYTKQLDSYENAVMNKRLEEMPESERERLFTEIEEERQRKLERQKQKSS